MRHRVQGGQVAARRVSEQLHAVEAQRLPQSLQVLDATGEGHLLHIAERRLTTAPLVVVDEAELVGPRVERPHVGAAEADCPVDDDNGDAVSHGGAGDLDVVDGNGLGRCRCHDGLLDPDRGSVRRATVDLELGFKVKYLTLNPCGGLP